MLTNVHKNSNLQVSVDHNIIDNPIQTNSYVYLIQNKNKLMHTLQKKHVEVHSQPPIDVRH
jgi:hypothetical protein